MATKSHVIPFSYSAGVLAKNPSYNDHTSALLQNKEYMLLALDMDRVTQAVSGRKITSMDVYVCFLRNPKGYAAPRSLFDRFDERNVTYTSKPRDSNLHADFVYQSSGWSVLSLSTIFDGWTEQYTGRKYKEDALFNGIIFYTGENIYNSNGAYTTHASTNQPYAIIYTEDVPFTTKEEYPQSGFVNEKTANTFGWSVAHEDSPAIIGEVRQKSAKFRWRTQGASGYNEIIVGTENKVIVPAGTFNANNIEWQVVVVSTEDVEGTPSQWFRLTTVDSKSTPAALYPKSLPIDGTKPITFTWSHIIETGSAQSRFELQTSADNGKTWVQLAAESTSGQTYTAPANTFAAGSLQWRVRTYNSDNAAGEWSAPATFIVRAAPTAAITGFDSKPRPTIRWQASGQQGYRVIAGIYDSGVKFGTDKTFKIPVYLPDGKTIVKVQVQNSFGLFSEPVSVIVDVKNQPAEAITLSTRAINNGASLTWSTDGVYTKYYIYRDGILIAKTTERTYTDLLTNGKHTYQVRGVTADDYYTLSNPAVEITACKCAVIADIATFDWLPLRFRRESSPTHETETQLQISYQYYSGRTLPVGETNGQRAAKHTFAYTFTDRDSDRKLHALIGKTVIFKDRHGDVVIGILEANSTSRDRFIETSFTITEVDTGGGVSYDL